MFRKTIHGLHMSSHVRRTRGPLRLAGRLWPPCAVGGACPCGGWAAAQFWHLALEAGKRGRWGLRFGWHTDSDSTLTLADSGSNPQASLPSEGPTAVGERFDACCVARWVYTSYALLWG